MFEFQVHWNLYYILYGPLCPHNVQVCVCVGKNHSRYTITALLKAFEVKESFLGSTLKLNLSQQFVKLLDFWVEESYIV